MDPPRTQNDDHHFPKSGNDGVIAGCWRQFSRPAHYAEDYNGGIGRNLEPLRRPRISRKHNSTSPINPTSQSPFATSYSSLVLSSPERIAVSSDYTAVSPQSSPFFAPSAQQNSSESSSIESPATDNSSPSSVSLFKSSISNGQDSSTPTKEGGSNSASSGGDTSLEHHPSASSLEQNASASSSSSSQTSTPAQPRNSSGTRNSSDDRSNTGTGTGSSGTPAKPRPSVPRIIIPDGTSINLSTPPTTPRLPHRTPLPAIMMHWPYTLQQIKERLRSQGRLPYRRNQVGPPRQAIDPTRNTVDQSLQDSQQSPGATGQDTVHIELTELSAVDNQEALADAAKAGDDPSSPKQDPRTPYMSELGVMGFQMGGRNDSLSSSEKDIWWDYEDSTTMSLFSRERWRRALCSRPGLFNLFKHLITTSLGLITILAIALTALGKIKNHQQVSDTIPDSLADNIMEAQIIVIKDFNRFQQSNYAQGNYVQLEDHPQLKTSSKIPIWNQLIRKDCFHKKCDIEDLGNEFFAFMHPESFGISLPHNWPSLCNSCIEISRNQFVYKTKVRILGDLTTCPADAAQTQDAVVSNPASSAPALTIQSIPAPSPTLATPTHKTRHHRHKPKRLETHIKQHNPSPDTPDKLQKRQETITLVSSDPLVQAPAIAQLPYLIVDPSTFHNLTMYDTQAALHEMNLLQVQFRFVLCDS
ncbi:hypothetical protein BGZ95_001886 [Linnemannia exigua]|uniref:Uncharacterized protein n=1 Tax=Linnemannia exigua TaxID=604196 RepID=A0AAD4DIS6_9FUNG|nr:hypothetical protein BGZ95_001886 [Linnemannia exigua]